MKTTVTYNADEATARMVVIDAAQALPELQRSRVIRGIYAQPVKHSSSHIRSLAHEVVLTAAVVLGALVVSVAVLMVVADIVQGASA